MLDNMNACKLTIGLPSYNNFTEVFFTVQALRMYHDLRDCEILVIDNYGDAELEKFVKNQGGTTVRYEKSTDKVGTSCAKNKVFEHARGEMVLCMDSHIMLKPGALRDIPVTDDLIHGPLMYCDLKNYCCKMLPVWRGQMWGIWGDYSEKLPEKPIEIWGMGGGLFLTKRNTWLKFNDRFRGFGGEEGYLQEKYRKAGRKVWCYPNLVWMHMFDRKIPHPVRLIDKIKNYLIGFEELGLDKKPIVEHFGEKDVKEAEQQLWSVQIRPNVKPLSRYDIALKNAIPPTIPGSKLISALCITYGRPHLLEEAIESFLKQDYENKELIIVNDLAGQTLIYDDHPQIKVFNFKERFPTLGEKRNKAIELSKGEILISWDDDDIMLPWRLSQVAKEFNANPDLGYFKPGRAWFLKDGGHLDFPSDGVGFVTVPAWNREAITSIGGYSKINVGEDADLDARLKSSLDPKNVKITTCSDDECSFIYGWRSDSFHISGWGFDKNGESSGMEKSENYIKSKPIQSTVVLRPHWKKDYLKLVTDSIKIKISAKAMADELNCTIETVCVK